MGIKQVLLCLLSIIVGLAISAAATHEIVIAFIEYLISTGVLSNGNSK